MTPRQILHQAVAAVPLLVHAGMTTPALATESAFTAAVPRDFEDLTNPKEFLVDVYFGGRQLGEARAVLKPGFLRFRDPASVAALLAPHGDAVSIGRALETDLPSNAGRVCTAFRRTECGSLQPEEVGIILDEERFRVDFFLSQSVANAAVPLGDGFLSPTFTGPALVSSLGAALSGSDSDRTFNFQSRTILSLGEGRLKSNLSFSSERGTVVDDFVFEVDRPNRRYAAGLFWAPGSGLVGRRRILGVGASSQFETRYDREQIEGTSLPVFVQQTSIAEILVDGRLAGTQVVEAGNQLLNTDGLPEGAYPILVKIREPGRAARIEQRFFIKDSGLPPESKARWRAFAGFISPTREGGLVSPTGDLYFEMGAAKRIAENIGSELTFIGVNDKLIAESGAVFFTDAVRIKLSGLLSTEGESGAVLQAISTRNGPVHFSVDIRRIRDPDGGGLIPGSFYSLGFDGGVPLGATRLNGDYTQVNATLGYGLGRANLRLYASYTGAKAEKSQYSIGPSADWLAIQRPQFQMRLEADGQVSRETVSGYVGMRFQFSAGNFASSGSSGQRFQQERGQRQRTKAVGNLDAEWSGRNEGLGHYALGVGFHRAIDGSSGRASGSLRSPYGNLKTDLFHDFGGKTQYSASIQTGLVLDRAQFALGARDLNESALLVSLEGNPSNGEFEVLVDNSPWAKVTAGKRIALFMQPYRDYEVRLRPVSASAVRYDSTVRKITLFPGNVARLQWTTARTVTVFGQVIGKDGTPIPNAALRGTNSEGFSNSDGFFQIDAASGERILLTYADGNSCNFMLNTPVSATDYVSAGKVICQ